MTKMLDSLYGIAKGQGTKIGLVGAVLTGLGAIVTEFAQAPCHDIGCWWALGVKLFGLLTAAGVVRAWREKVG